MINDITCRININTGEVTERIADKLPGWHDTSDSTLTHVLLDAISREFIVFNFNMSDVQQSKWLDTAFGTSLDNLGALINCSRFPGENDNSYKARLKIYVTTFTGGGTKKSITNSFITTFSLGETDIEIVDKAPYPSFKLYLDVGAIGNGATGEKVEDMIEQTKAAGVNYEWAFLSTTPTDSFAMSDTTLVIVHGIINIGQFDLDNFDQCYFGDDWNAGRYSIDEYNESVYAPYP
jgi:hypothetical protein